MRPTGRLHLGNLFGALENWVKMQDDYDCYYCVVDWHALTTDYENPLRIRDNVREMVIDWLSCGIDPQKAVVFKQSDVKEHAELHLLLSMLTPLSWLERVPTYKEQLQQIKGRNLFTYGFLGYPLLQAADILVYRANAVPVGEDQAPHIELTREIARRFNHLYQKKIFPEPETLLNVYKVVPGLDNRKMSKSYNNVIEISTPPKEIPAKVRMMITDPGRIKKDDPGNPHICSVFAYHRIFNQDNLGEVEESCKEGSIGCVECKKSVATHLQNFLDPIYHRRKEFENNPLLIKEVLAEGGKKARAVARETMEEVRQVMKLV
ncbi:MAG TPA: tryptophan--tRNA ligase [Firmicutes bacterium]|nr:tryptophan--tRNA ligase [Bacillota bacterium]